MNNIININTVKILNTLGISPVDATLYTLFKSSNNEYEAVYYEDLEYCYQQYIDAGWILIK